MFPKFNIAAPKPEFILAELMYVVFPACYTYFYNYYSYKPIDNQCQLEIKITVVLKLEIGLTS